MPRAAVTALANTATTGVYVHARRQGTRGPGDQVLDARGLAGDLERRCRVAWRVCKRDALRHQDRSVKPSACIAPSLLREKFKRDSEAGTPASQNSE